MGDLERFLKQEDYLEPSRKYNQKFDAIQEIDKMLSDFYDEQKRESRKKDMFKAKLLNTINKMEKRK